MGSARAATLGHYVELTRGTTYKSSLLERPGPVLLGLASIARNGGFRSDSLRTYGGDSPEKLLLRPGDLYVSLKDVTQSGDLLGSVARVPPTTPLGRLTQDTVKLTLGPDAPPRDYLYWVLRSPEYRVHCRSHAIGTTNLSISRDDFLAFEVPAATPARLRLVELLEAIELKIELNRRTNETLEAMARALFKSWFVDFDPVRAKAAGKQPAGMDAATAALFPSEFVESEIGEIPKGWHCQPLSAWSSALSGGTPAKATPAFWSGTIPWISPKAMMSIHADESDEMVTEKALGNGTRLAPIGSCLVMVRGMGLHEEVRVSQARCDVAFNQDVKALVPASIQSSLLLFALLNAQEDLLRRVESSGHGTGRLPSDILLSHPITMPPGDTQARLGAHFDAMNSRIDWARKEVRTLAATRDALLPRLLSGELRIPDAERIVSRAT